MKACFCHTILVLCLVDIFGKGFLTPSPTEALSSREHHPTDPLSKCANTLDSGTQNPWLVSYERSFIALRTANEGAKTHCNKCLAMAECCFL